MDALTGPRVPGAPGAHQGCSLRGLWLGSGRAGLRRGRRAMPACLLAASPSPRPVCHFSLSGSPASWHQLHPPVPPPCPIPLLVSHSPSSTMVLLQPHLLSSLAPTGQPGEALEMLEPSFLPGSPSVLPRGNEEWEVHRDPNALLVAQQGPQGCVAIFCPSTMGGCLWDVCNVTNTSNAVVDISGVIQDLCRSFN